jgi:hypothetical protein
VALNSLQKGSKTSRVNFLVNHYCPVKLSRVFTLGPSAKMDGVLATNFYTQFSPFMRTPVHGVDSFLPCQSMGHTGDAINNWQRSGQVWQSQLVRQIIFSPQISRRKYVNSKAGSRIRTDDLLITNQLL